MKKSSCVLALLFSGVGMMNTTISWAATASQTSPTNTQSASVKKIAQSNVECLSLSYNVGGTVHNSTLIMKNSVGLMITEFYSRQLGRNTRVQQSMRAQADPDGLFIFGSNPVYPQTTRPYPDYAPDNFFFKTTGSRVVAVNCDAAKVCVPVRVEVCSR
jgi:hypothetical protein